MSFLSWLGDLFSVTAPAMSEPAPVAPPLEFSGPATPMPAGAYDLAARQLGIDVATIHAVAEVETVHEAFYPDTRPAILYEAATFHRLTDGRFTGAVDRHGVLIDTPTWTRGLYGADGAHQYERLADAMALDRGAALQSTSWGMFQIMGENYDICGFVDIEGFVAAQCSGEAAHLAAFVAFINARKLGPVLRRKDWATFARIYNGSGQVAEYAEMIAEAYAKFGG